MDINTTLRIKMIQSNVFMLIVIVCLSLIKVYRCGEGVDSSMNSTHAQKEDETISQNQQRSSIVSTSRLQCSSNPLYFACHPMSVDNKCCKHIDRKLESVSNECNTINESLVLFKHDVSKNISDVRKMDILRDKMSKETLGSINALQMEINTVDSNVKTFNEQIGKNVEMKIKSAEDKSDNAINHMSNKLVEQIKYLTGTTDNKLKEVETELNSMSKEFVKSKHDLTDLINVETQQIKTEINERSERLHTELVDASKQSETDIAETNRRLSDVKHVIDKHKLESTQSLADAEQRLNTLIIDKLLEVGSKFDRSLEDLNKNVATLKTEVAQRIKEEVEQLASQTSKVNHRVTQQKEIVDIIYPNTFNKEMFVMAFLLLVVLLGINYMIVYILVKRTSPAQAERPRHLEHSEEPHSPVEIYNRIAFPRALSPEMAVPLDDSVAIISFYEEAQKQHKRLMRTIKESLPERMLSDLKVQYHVIRRHENIPGIPHSKLCFMFVEFSERHVIIEEQGLGLGDLKRKTASFIDKLGACLVIFYVKDPGSRHLANGELFNSRIHCVTSQPELITLNQQGRFLSLYDKFTDTQLEHLVDIVADNLVHTSLGNTLHLRL